MFKYKILKKMYVKINKIGDYIITPLLMYKFSIRFKPRTTTLTDKI